MRKISIIQCIATLKRKRHRPRLSDNGRSSNHCTSTCHEFLLQLNFSKSWVWVFCHSSLVRRFNFDSVTALGATCWLNDKSCSCARKCCPSTYVSAEHVICRLSRYSALCSCRCLSSSRSSKLYSRQKGNWARGRREVIVSRKSWRAAAVLWRWMRLDRA